MNNLELETLPGGEIVLAGLRDLASGSDSLEAAAVAMASGRLRAVGLIVPPQRTGGIASHHLYDLLERDRPADAHSRFNAIARRIASFATAAEHAAPR